MENNYLSIEKLKKMTMEEIGKLISYDNEW
jgi:hypothetical protein